MALNTSHFKATEKRGPEFSFSPEKIIENMSPEMLMLASGIAAFLVLFSIWALLHFRKLKRDDQPEF